ncbi:MAG: hypothetical protein CO002_03235 [Candidatus Portnoybacteria bacterium CG_4_8_14_3_um_filter_44_10]|uniref:Uncharacterized protein n=3 Tax=Candidatus Portnoyibacteriota TaxID=1817913 RepID=A0A2M7IFB7_9BACT|nr:MAG: hypothetical protein CO002_03235 [Candidatus Portnoybacteria bacterium CG_4_8_14_3_um_filter_44_10]PIZ70418.1 MAG: hypothetical protein COY11_02675 [Candidatus Portnoybacteria bacterium CG_4_10_14_0_2_um_filter_44_20]PJA63323.1 MAG: hypothetical protein CO161_01675 [Candidatus Portnoybacteria bacterium CG_4_9_14_3_um_filter_44_9]
MNETYHKIVDECYPELAKKKASYMVSALIDGLFFEWLSDEKNHESVGITFFCKEDVYLSPEEAAAARVSTADLKSRRLNIVVEGKAVGILFCFVFNPFQGASNICFLRAEGYIGSNAVADALIGKFKDFLKEKVPYAELCARLMKLVTQGV